MNYFAIVNNVFRHDLGKQYIKEFNDNHLLLLVYIQKFKGYSGEMNFCLGWLFDDLKINYNLQQDLINCFSDLVKWNLIDLINEVDNINRNTRLQVAISEYDDRFTQVLFNEVEKIFNLDIDIRTKKTMLFLYTDIASWIDTKGYCYTSYHYFKQDLNTKSDNRINDSLKLLKENKLIDYDKPGQVLVDNQITQGNNIYVLCSDKDYKDNLARGLANRRKQYVEGKAKIYKGEQSNYQRSIKQKLNNLWKKYNKNKITDIELKELGKLEKEYYELIKLDKDKLEKLNFITIDVREEVKEIVDAETGEIIEDDGTSSWGELNPMEDFESLEDLKIENHKQEVEDDDISFLFTDAELESGIDRPDTKDNAIDVLKKYSPEEIEKLFG